MNHEQVARLKRSVADFNSRRKARPSEKIDLSNASLTCVNLAGADLRNANLKKALLKGSNLRGAKFDYADLTGADLRETSSENTTFKSSILKNAKFAKADLTGAELLSADATGADFSGANLTGAAFRSASIKDAVFLNARLKETVFNIEHLAEVRRNGGDLCAINRKALKSGKSYGDARIIILAAVTVLALGYILIVNFRLRPFASMDPREKAKLLITISEPQLVEDGSLFYVTGKIVNGSNFALKRVVFTVKPREAASDDAGMQSFRKGLGIEEVHGIERGGSKNFRCRIYYIGPKFKNELRSWKNIEGIVKFIELSAGQK